MNKTDIQLGYEHGTLGLESRYPNNANYAEGFRRGTVWLMRELEATRPDDDMRPGGTNDMHADAFHA